jgi:hypothetical protein
VRQEGRAEVKSTVELLAYQSYIQLRVEQDGRTDGQAGNFSTPPFLNHSSIFACPHCAKVGLVSPWKKLYSN